MFTESKSHLEILMSLGLTKNEARVYFCLVNQRSSDSPKSAKEIARITGISRQDIYRIMPSLHQKSLVEKIIVAPTHFKAIPLKQGITNLLNQKKVQHEKLMESSMSLIRYFEDNRDVDGTSENEGNFILVPQKSVLFKRMKNSVKKCMKSVDIITSEKRIAHGYFEFLEERKEALKRGVKFRFLTYQTERKAFSMETYLADKAGSFIYRMLLNPPEAILVIIDKKEVYFITLPDASLSEAPALWSNNRSLLAIAQHYFDDLWNTAS